VSVCGRRSRGPVSEADKLLRDLENAETETKLAILISGWGRGLAAGLEELALAVDELQRQAAGKTGLPAPAPSSPDPDSPQSPRNDRSADADVANASEEQLVDEAKRSRAATAELRKQTEEARRELEP